MIGREGPDPVNQLLVSIFLIVAMLTIASLAAWLLLR